MSEGDPRSVLFIGAFPRPSALERFVSGDLAGRIQGRGWKVRLTSRQPRRLARLPSILQGAWLGSRSCEIACVDVFSGAAFLWAELACAILRRRQKPYVLILHGGNLPDFAKRHGSRVANLLNSAAAVTCPSPYLATEMRTLRPDILIVPNGFDLSKYPFRERRPPLRLLVWLRSFHQIYNPVMAIEVLAVLRQRHDLRLAMYGPDKRDGTLQAARQKSAQWGVAAAVDFREAIPKEDVPDALARGDTFLNTANFDNTPVSVIEAMACGLPVVTASVGGIPYLLEQGKTALLVRAGDVKEMAAAVTRLVTEPELASRLSLSGRKLAESFDWAVVLPQWLRLLSSVLPKAPLAEA